MDVTKPVVSEFSDALSRFEMDENAKKNLLSCLEIYAREVVEETVKEEAGKALRRLKERYLVDFKYIYIYPRQVGFGGLGLKFYLII